MKWFLCFSTRLARKTAESSSSTRRLHFGRYCAYQRTTRHDASNPYGGAAMTYDRIYNGEDHPERKGQACRIVPSHPGKSYGWQTLVEFEDGQRVMLTSRGVLKQR